MKRLFLRPLPPAALAAATLALAACSSEPPAATNAVQPDAALSEEGSNAVPVELPPMLKASKTYRCKDNSLIFVDFMTDDKTANFKSAKDGPITPLKAAEAGQPYVSADGATTVTGQGDAITYNGTACKTG